MSKDSLISPNFLRGLGQMEALLILIDYDFRLYARMTANTDGRTQSLRMTHHSVLS